MSRTRARIKAHGARVFWAALCLALHAGFACADVAAPAPGEFLFDQNETIELELKAPFRILLRDRYGPSTYSAGELSYRDRDQREVVLPVEIRSRGKTRRRKDTCEFPPLRLRFAAGGTNTLFDGQKTLKLVTHCNNNDSYDQYVLREYLAYRIYNQLTQRGHRVRLVRITYVEADGRVGATRYGIFLEDWEAVAARNDLTTAEVAGAVNIDKLSGSDANRIAVFQYMIGNQDWSVLWPEPDENCCHNTRPLLAPDGTVVPLPYDFDFAGIVNAPYARAKGGSDNVRMRRYGGLCSTQAQLAATLPLFHAQRQAIYALYDQPELEPRHRKSTLLYLDGFYRVIEDPEQVEAHMLRHCKME